ncbi:MAG: hypothetical protein ABJB16_08300 [Saprospiraceae bacterium]
MQTFLHLLLLRQTPHSLFWNVDAIGNIFMELTMLFAAPVFKKQGFQRWVRISFLALPEELKSRATMKMHNKGMTKKIM